MLFIQDAYAQSAGAPQGGGVGSLVMLVAVFAIMYFFMIRPQQKKMKEHQNLVSSLEKGDEVSTSGGLMGRIINLDQYAIDLEIAKNTIVRIQRPFVTQVLPKGSLKAALGSDDKADKGKNKAEKVEKNAKPAKVVPAAANNDAKPVAPAEQPAAGGCGCGHNAEKDAPKSEEHAGGCCGGEEKEDKNDVTLAKTETPPAAEKPADPAPEADSDKKA